MSANNTPSATTSGASASSRGNAVPGYTAPPSSLHTSTYRNNEDNVSMNSENTVTYGYVDLLTDIADSINIDGASLSPDDFVVKRGDSINLNVPSNQAWDAVCAKFFSCVNAVSRSEKSDSLVILISDCIMNTTSPDVKRTIPIKWPGGATVSIDDAWIVPSPFKARNFLHHPTAQNIATAILVHSDNDAFAKSVRRKNHYHDSVDKSVMFDFVYAATNPHAARFISDINRSKKLKIRGGKHTDSVEEDAYTSMDGKSQDRDNYFSDPYGNK